MCRKIKGLPIVIVATNIIAKENSDSELRGELNLKNRTLWID